MNPARTTLHLHTLLLDLTSTAYRLNQGDEMSNTTCGHPDCNADPDHPLRSQNAQLLAALEKVTALLEHWVLPGNKVLGGTMQVVAKGHAEQARAAIASIKEEQK